MKEPPISRLRKKPAATPTTTSLRKIKLICSFNGAFHLRPPSNKLKYLGGETRIISVDRNIGFSKLRSRISDLCPKLRSFSLKYQLFSSSGRVRCPDTGVDAGAPLISIVSDEDVWCMIEEYEKLEVYGKQARLWVFVCSDDGGGNECGGIDDINECGDNDNKYNNSNVNGNSEFCVNYIESEALYCSQLCKAQFDDKLVVKNHVNDGDGDGGGGFRFVDDSLRKAVLKRNLMPKRSERIPSICQMEFASHGDHKQKYDYPLVDLASQLKGSTTPENAYQVSMLDYHLCASQDYGAPSPPLKPRDGNLQMKMNDPMCRFSRPNIQVSGNGTGIGAGYSNHLHNSGMNSVRNCVDIKMDLWKIGQGSVNNLNRENIMPCAVGHNSQSCNNQLDATSSSVKPSCCGERACNAYQNGIRNHRVVKNDATIQGTNPYHVRNHRSNLAETGNHRTTKLDGRQSVGKFYCGLKPNSNIPRQGQSIKLYTSNTWKPSFPKSVMERRLSVIDSGINEDNSSCSLAVEQSGSSVLEYGCSGSNQNAIASVLNQSHLSCDVIESPPQCVEAMESQKDLFTGSPYLKHQLPCQRIYKNHSGVTINNELLMVDQQKVLDVSSFSNNLCECHNKPTDSAGGSMLSSHSKSRPHCLKAGIASSMDLLYNLSLSSSKGVKPPAPSLFTTTDTDDALPKPEWNHLDFMDEGQLSTGPTTADSNGVSSRPSLQNAADMEKDQVYKEEIQQDTKSALTIDEKSEIGESIQCSKVIGGIPTNLAAFYTHLATRELQTIKSSDLEYIKELGSGTYGTVYYGKWKGSDVAIKRIKPSCFTEGSLVEDGLVVDFWKEAHILGQLHHPNIVAFYGVVTDGPANNLATVTEYMVNGSLKQVLRRKDRTIDRRKRLILARDAAFGMEYLHEKNIVHFDLKSHNLLVNMRDPHRPVCKIGDLGLSKIKQRTLVSGGVRGTIPWMAPELLTNNKNMVTEKVDVYSFGVVMWELLTGDEPYAKLRSEEIIAGINKGTMRPEIPSWCDPAWRSLMERCWSSDPVDRPPFSKIAKELRAMAATMNIK